MLRSPAGFHVLKLLERRGAGGAAPVTQTRARHILIRTSEVVSEEDARRRLQVLRGRIESGADFAELARLNSEDGTAARGGDLGWVYPGDTVTIHVKQKESVGGFVMMHGAMTCGDRRILSVDFAVAWKTPAGGGSSA